MYPECYCILLFSVKQKTVYELRLHCWKWRNKWGKKTKIISIIFLNLYCNILPCFWSTLFFLFFAQVLHYVEKPSTFVSDIINCGIYLFNPDIFQHIGTIFQRNQQDMLLWVKIILHGDLFVTACFNHLFHYFSLFICLFSLFLSAIVYSFHNHQISLWWVSGKAAWCSFRAQSKRCELCRDHLCEAWDRIGCFVIVACIPFLSGFISLVS